MNFAPGTADRTRSCGSGGGSRLLAALALAAATGAAAQAQQPQPPAAMLLERLCSASLRPNEEDRLFGLISLTVRATIKYENGVFDPDLIDDSMQDALAAITAACPQLAAMGEPYRLGRAVELARDATLRRLRDGTADYNDRQIEKATAADLSEELSAPEIDAWLEALPPSRRALALFLYASHLPEREMADAVGLDPRGLTAGFHALKGNLLKFFRAEAEGGTGGAGEFEGKGRALEYRIAGRGLAGLLKPDPGQPSAPATETPGPAPITVRVTGISSEFYAGWSLLATVTGLPDDQSLDIPEPILLAPDQPGRKRMLTVAAEEIPAPRATDRRRFLLKAYAIDADKEGAGLGDTFHLVAPTIDNPQAQQTLRNRALAAIEVARCLWHDYGTADDPGMCR